MKPVPSTAVRTHSNLWMRTDARVISHTALAVLVGVLVVGILGMHALATHGTPTVQATAAPTSMTAMASEHQTSTTASASHATHAHATTTATARADAGMHAETSADAGSANGSVPGHDMSAMVMLCVVMLGAAALTLLVLLAVRIVGPLLPAAFQPAEARARTMQWVRGTGPPHVWEFSVIRC